MSDAREEVLARLHRAIAGAPPPAGPRRDYRVADDEVASLSRFVDRLADYQATVHQLEAQQVAAAVARLSPGRVVVPDGVPSSWLAGLDVVRDDPPLTAAELDGLDAVLTTCVLAIADTGTVVLDGGPGQGRRALSLVPDHHVLVVHAHQVVATVPQAIQRLDPRRPQTWISGPSATSDIELERVEGVHGPRRLDVLLVTPTLS